jgi:hypothetical protein
MGYGTLMEPRKFTISKSLGFVFVLFVFFLHSNPTCAQPFDPEECIPLAPLKIQVLYHQLKTSPSVISDFRRNDVTLKVAENLKNDGVVQRAVRDWAVKEIEILEKYQKGSALGAVNEHRNYELRVQLDPDIKVVAKELRESIPFVYRHFGHGKKEDIDIDDQGGEIFYELSYEQSENERLEFSTYIDGPKGHENLILKSCEIVSLGKGQDRGEHCSVVDVINLELTRLPPKKSHFGFENFREFIFAMMISNSFQPENESALLKCLSRKKAEPMEWEDDKSLNKI